jgi:hypothetical protein
VLAAYLMGLGYANHMAGLLPLPALGLWRALAAPGDAAALEADPGGVAALALGVTPFATQPIRAAHFPAINEGEPSGCRARSARLHVHRGTYERSCTTSTAGSTPSPR